MKIAIVHEYLTKIGGAEKVLETVHQLYPDAPIYTLLYNKKGTKYRYEDGSYKIIPSGLNKLPSIFRARPKLLLGLFPRAIEEFSFSEYDIVISLSNSFGHAVITKPNTMHICYCYSPTRYLWDWNAEYLAENHIGYGLMGLYIRNMLHKIRVWDKVSSSRVDRWIAQSKTVQGRICKYYRSDSVVIFPPTNMASKLGEVKTPENFYLIVSRLEPYKKIDLVIRAFNKNKKALVVIGSGSDMKRLQQMALKNIKFLNWQSDEKVIEYMKKSYALIFPGEEDFGLTPVETMALGRPVVAYNKGGVTETVVDGVSGYFFDRASEESLNAAIDRLETNYRQFDPIKCHNQALKFSEDNFKKQFSNFIKVAYEEYKTKYSKD